jgi:uncharacterized protein with ParB-like and HNH nuclease domain
MDTGILPPELKSIEQLFTGDARYSVPRYQRSFAWGKDEVEELWDDITSAVGRNSEYFLGTIVLQKIGPSEFEIIDGQQRLACLTMIFSAIRNVFLAAQDERAEQVRMNFLGAKDYAREAPIRPKLILNKVNNELFVQHVVESDNFENVKEALRTTHPTDSNRLLLEAYLYFLERVATEAAKQGTQSDRFIVPLINCLRSSVKLITITVLSGEDASLFFESLNARGKELAVSDLVKNRLFSEAGDEVLRAEPLWDKLESELIRRSIPDYLRHFWIAKKADSRNLIVREKHLYRLIVQDVKDNQAAALALLRDLATTATEYVKISDYNLWPDDDAYDKSFEESINDLQLFRVTQCNPLLLNAIQILGTPKEIVKVFRTAANFSFRYFIIGNQSPGNLERQTNNIAFGIRAGTLANARDVADAFRAINPDPAFRNDFSLASLSKARTKIARYTLAKLNNHLWRNAGRQGGEQVVNPDAKQVNLEHVLPQSVPSTWKSHFTKGVNPLDYVSRIGNLTLLTKKVNSEVGDASFLDKQREALNNSALPINEIFHTLSNWGDKEIEQRQAELARIAAEVWSL